MIITEQQRAIVCQLARDAGIEEYRVGKDITVNFSEGLRHDNAIAVRVRPDGRAIGWVRAIGGAPCYVGTQESAGQDWEIVTT